MALQEGACKGDRRRNGDKQMKMDFKQTDPLCSRHARKDQIYTAQSGMRYMIGGFRRTMAHKVNRSIGVSKSDEGDAGKEVKTGWPKWSKPARSKAENEVLMWENQPQPYDYKFTGFISNWRTQKQNTRRLTPGEHRLTSIKLPHKQLLFNNNPR